MNLFHAFTSSSTMLVRMSEIDVSGDSVDFLDLLQHSSGRNADERLEAVTFECLANTIADRRAESLLSVLGFQDDFLCFTIAGYPKHTYAGARASIHKVVRDLGGGNCIVGSRDGVCVALMSPQGAVTPEITCTNMMPSFDAMSPVCIGPLRRGTIGACRSIRAALFSIAAAPALSTIPRPMRADDVLPERALLGDDDAVDELVNSVYASLQPSGPDDPTLETVHTFLRTGSSLEATAKELSVHPNTVRYRLKRAAETTGWDATDPREAYVLHTAIALGRMRAFASQHDAGKR